MRDSENTMLYSPNDHQGNKYFGMWNRLVHLQSHLNYEDKEKYLNEYQARFNARLEVNSIPKCFDKCVTDIETPGLTSADKNCMRECYFKNVTSREDLSSVFSQKLAFEATKSMREQEV